MKLIVSIFAGVLAACGGKSVPPTSTPPLDTPAVAVAAPDAASAAVAGNCEVTGGTSADVDCAITIMDAYADKVCACTTADCANGITNDMTAWLDTTGKQLDQAQPDTAQLARMDTISTKYDGCMQKTVGAGAGSAH